MAEGLTFEERETFESLAESYEGEPLGKVFEGVLRKDDEPKGRTSR